MEKHYLIRAIGIRYEYDYSLNCMDDTDFNYIMSRSPSCVDEVSFSDFEDALSFCEREALHHLSEPHSELHSLEIVRQDRSLVISGDVKNGAVFWRSIESLSSDEIDEKKRDIESIKRMQSEAMRGDNYQTHRDLKYKIRYILQSMTNLTDDEKRIFKERKKPEELYYILTMKLKLDYRGDEKFWETCVEACHKGSTFIKALLYAESIEGLSDLYAIEIKRSDDSVVISGDIIDGSLSWNDTESHTKNGNSRPPKSLSDMDYMWVYACQGTEPLIKSIKERSKPAPSFTDDEKIIVKQLHGARSLDMKDNQYVVLETLISSDFDFKGGQEYWKISQQSDYDTSSFYDALLYAKMIENTPNLYAIEIIRSDDSTVIYGSIHNRSLSWHDLDSFLYESSCDETSFLSDVNRTHKTSLSELEGIRAHDCEELQSLMTSIKERSRRLPSFTDDEKRIFNSSSR